MGYIFDGLVDEFEFVGGEIALSHFLPNGFGSILERVFFTLVVHFAEADEFNAFDFASDGGDLVDAHHFGFGVGFGDGWEFEEFGDFAEGTDGVDGFLLGLRIFEEFIPDVVGAEEETEGEGFEGEAFLDGWVWEGLHYSGNRSFRCSLKASWRAWEV